jgi:Protein of unknown function (DUF2384)
MSLTSSSKPSKIVLEIEMSMATVLLPPTIAGYSFDRSADLADEDERQRLSASAMKAFLKIARRWALSEAQARGLLGGIASSTFHSWKVGRFGRSLDQDTLMRISLIIGIFKALNIYFGKPWADRWVVLANRGPMFAGQTPIDYMLRHGQPGMVQIRRMLDAWRGGH